jgi:hypothetical protein
MYKSTLLLAFSCTANDFNNHSNRVETVASHVQMVAEWFM